jgi:hypothetical protein
MSENYQSKPHSKDRINDCSNQQSTEARVHSLQQNYRYNCEVHEVADRDRPAIDPADQVCPSRPIEDCETEIKRARDLDKQHVGAAPTEAELAQDCQWPKGSSEAKNRHEQGTQAHQKFGLHLKALYHHRLILLVRALEVRDLVIALEVPDPRRHFVDQIFVMRD